MGVLMNNKMEKTMDYKDDITFVLPVRNQPVHLKKCLDSLLKQTIKGEIIVIDDASTDITPFIIESYENDIDKIITNKERKGSAYCRNMANQLVETSIIAVCDCDYYYPNRGLNILEFFKQYPDVDVFYSALHIKPHSYLDNELYRMQAFEWDFKSKCPISHPTVAYRKKVAENVKYPEKSLETDLYEFFLLEAHKKGYKFGWDDTVQTTKYEGVSHRNQDESRKLKKEMYKPFGIEYE